MEEIIEHVYYEIRNSGYEKKLIGGIVVTGGGSQLKHITQLFEFITGMDTRIGYPTEHLGSSNNFENLTSPMYATGIGLVIKGFENAEKTSSDKEPAHTKTKKVKTHSDPEKKGSFFDAILKKVPNIFADED